MTDWTAGYTTDIAYTYGYYAEQSPALMRVAALLKGKKGPDPSKPFTYCELGSGWGLTTNILAAANPNGEFHATDFNPAQVAGSRALAAEAGLDNVRFSDASFQEYIDDRSLPDFDVISLHGIISWISDENRQAIVDFIKKKLKVGGVVYISYNALPGWAQAAPLRRLLSDLGKMQGGPITARVDKALAFAGRLKEANIALFASTNGMPQRFDSLLKQNRSYLAHEYFNQDWNPMYFADVAKELSRAKLTFIGSVAILDHIDSINLKPEHLALLKEIADPEQREQMRDFMTMDQFRRDLFGRGVLDLAPGEARDQWLDLRLALVVPHDGEPLKMQGRLGQAVLQKEAYLPIFDALASGPKTLKELLADPKVKALGDAQIMESLKAAVGNRSVDPCLPAAGEAERAKRTRAFNTAVMKRARWSGTINFLASPVTGAGVAADRFNQLFLLGLQDKEKDVPLSVWDHLTSQNQKLTKEGRTLETAEENLAELRDRFQQFSDKALPIYRNLGIA